MYFAPVYDGKFFPKDIATMKKQPVANNVPYIVGCNNTEGHGILTNNFPKGFKSGITKEVYEETLRNLLGELFCVSFLQKKCQLYNGLLLVVKF